MTLIEFERRGEERRGEERRGEESRGEERRRRERGLYVSISRASPICSHPSAGVTRRREETTERERERER